MLDSPAISKAPLWLLAPLALAGGCYVEADSEPIDDIDATQQSLCWNGVCSCPSWDPDCGTNGPRIGAFAFHELNLDGEANQQGFFLKRVEVRHKTSGMVALDSGGLRFERPAEGLGKVPELVGTRTAYEYAGGWQWNKVTETYRGPALDGARFVVGSIHAADFEFSLIIDETTRANLESSGDFQPLEYWVDPAPLRTYLIRREGPRDGEVAWLCEPKSFPYRTATYEVVPSGPAAVPSSTTSPATADHLAVLATGHRYNDDAKTVYVYKPDHYRWITFGCAGSIAAKAELMRYTWDSAKAVGSDYSRPRHRAFVKMLAADYCGTGTSYTMPGDQLTWVDGTQQYPPLATSVIGTQLPEAKWNQYGATCIDRLRMAGEYPELASQVVSACGQDLPDCSAGAPGLLSSQIWRPGPDVFDNPYQDSSTSYGTTVGIVKLP